MRGISLAMRNALVNRAIEKHFAQVRGQEHREYERSGRFIYALPTM
jgi:hypothetical protein